MLIIKKFQTSLGLSVTYVDLISGNRGSIDVSLPSGEGPSLLVGFAGSVDPGFVRHKLHTISRDFLKERT